MLCFLYLFPEPAASRAEGAFQSAAAGRAGAAGPPAGSNPVTRTIEEAVDFCQRPLVMPIFISDQINTFDTKSHNYFLQRHNAK